MKTFELKGEVRTDIGKKATKAFRKEDKIPAVIYGGEKADKAIHFTVTNSDVRKLIYTPEIYLVDLTVGKDNYKAILKDVQVHPVTDEILHLDFLHVFENKPITIDVPVVLDGLAEGVKAGGKLSLDLRKLKVRALYDKVPEKVHVDVSGLALGKSIQVGELHFEGLELLNAKNGVVCRVQLTRAARGLAAKNG
ncbi:MAG: 50S ribosomal protein L25/general stress protein Ctc [Dysgonomonas sp.]|jgi:large subunit ribosomal protein L25|uniref:50S ribosomal protein L25/general stress protein Ctc n=1 Tax=unclassified Dysgonomonas TaxID=2630389 RepID=UPI0025BC8BF6|nr:MULTISPECIES: 50S ribosomal protein L25/general stress protein Ctc [unclassified Dysgonomonas]MDR1715476.1 50S ribosomal protein L25/general stress protein Ctc [Prevotella sp.]MDR2005235.1 50S ribosomal protein L25/general stress protein Ctc [Prevotella sp.]HMM02191.1 50S ribosomal protein L25/general stress protein Ctc [Dysgonomonas sp.]